MLKIIVAYPRFFLDLYNYYFNQNTFNWQLVHSKKVSMFKSYKTQYKYKIK